MQKQLAAQTALATHDTPKLQRAASLAERLAELRGRREAVAAAAQTALAGPLDEGSRQVVEVTLGRIEAALRARAVLSA